MTSPQVFSLWVVDSTKYFFNKKSLFRLNYQKRPFFFRLQYWIRTNVDGFADRHLTTRSIADKQVNLPTTDYATTYCLLNLRGRWILKASSITIMHCCVVITLFTELAVFASFSVIKTDQRIPFS